MKMGFAKVRILPSLPIALAGFAKERIAQEVLDEVYAKVVVFQEQKKRYVVVSYDLVGISHVVYQQLEESLQQAKITYDHLLVCATHTHSSFGGTVESDRGVLKGTEYIFTPFDPSRVETLVSKTKEAIVEAINDVKEGSIRVNSAVMDKVGSNRNDKNKQGDPLMGMAYLSQKNGKKVVLYHYACHPTVLNHLNTKVSSDFVGAVEALANADQYEFAMFFNGSCGDISTRFTRVGSGYDEVKRYAKMIYDTIKAKEEGAIAVSELHMDCIVSAISLQRKQVQPVEEALANLKMWEDKVEAAKKEKQSTQAIRVLDSYREGAMLAVTLAQNPPTEATHTFGIMVFQMNAYYFVCIPGELFSELSNQVKNKNIRFITYANGYLGYYANAQSFDERYYEAMSSPFEKGEAEKMMQQIETIIKQHQKTLSN